MRDQGRLVEWFDDKAMASFNRMMLRKIAYSYILKILRVKDHAL